MNETEFEEDIDNLRYIGHWFVILNERLGELCPLLGVDAHNVAQEEDVVRLEVDFFGVLHNLLELSRLGEAHDHLVGGVGAEVN